MRPNYRQNAQWTFRNRSQGRNRNENYNNDYTRGRSRDRHDNRPVQPQREESRSNSRVSTNHDCVRRYRCREYDYFASECPNILTDEEPDYDDADPASLQMMMQNYYPIDSGGELEYLNLKKQEWCHPIFSIERKDRWKSKLHTEQRGHVFD